MNKEVIIKKIAKLIAKLKKENQKYEAIELEKIYFNFKKKASEEELKYMDFSKIDEEEPKNQKERFLLFAEAVAKKLNLYSPMFLGSGAGAYAFSASNEDGQNVVMKFIPQREISIYEKIKNIKDYESSEYYSSFLPEIYEIKTIEELNNDNKLDVFLNHNIRNYDSGISQTLGSFGVVVMEELEKMNEDILRIISVTPKHDHNNFRLLLNSLDNDINNLLSNINNKIENFFSNQIIIYDDNILNLHRSIIDIIYSNLNNIKKLNKEFYFNIKNITLKINNLILIKINEIKKLYKNINLSNNLDSLIKIINEELNNFQAKVIKKIESNPFSLEEPNIKGQENYISKMNDLRNNSDLIPLDLHGGNIMVRPNTQEIVIPDVGNFSLKSEFNTLPSSSQYSDSEYQSEKDSSS